MNKIKIKMNNNLDDFYNQVISEHVNKNGLDLKCPNCEKEIHLSFSGDTCKFCNTVIRFGVDSNE